MADNTTVPPNVGGDSIRDKDRSGVKTQVVGLDLNIGGATEQLAQGAVINGINSLPSNDDSVRSLLELLLLEFRAITGALGLSAAITAPTPIAKPDPIIAGAARAVASSANAQVIAAPTINRSGLAIYNSSTAILYLLLAASGTVATTLFTVALQPNDYYEVPQGPGGCYKGAITGIWSAANGFAMVTEWTA